MNSKLVSLLATVSILAIGCVTTAPTEPPRTYHGQKGPAPRDMGIMAQPTPATAAPQDGAPASLGSSFGRALRRDQPAPPAAPAPLPGLTVRRVEGFAPRIDSNGDVAGFAAAPGARSITFLCSQRCWSGTPTAQDLTSAIRSGSAIIVQEE